MGRIVCIHCSATPEGSRLTFDQCRKMHMQKNGWSDIGYNIYIEKDGSIYFGRPIGYGLAHAKGHNNGDEYIAICYEGGLDKNGKPKDTRTEAQKEALAVCRMWLEWLTKVDGYCGHRDLSPDRNHDGVITPDEWLKACPCFDVKNDTIFK